MRKLKLYFLILTLALSLALPTTLAQRKDGRAKTNRAATVLAARGVETISANQLREYLSFIASDEMEGRDTPSRGLDTTAKFIAMNLDRWGFKPMGDDTTFFQRIALRRDQLDGAHSSAVINGRKFNFGDDFLPNAVSATITGPLVYAGNGWVVKSKNMDAYQGVDVKDKIIVVSGQPFPGFPRGITRADLAGTQGVDWINPNFYAQQHGAKAVVTITVAAKTEHPPTQNIVAVWEGGDPVLKNEYVALGAHYDHIGICAPGTADPICNGADDDGSGTTALLGMAEAISHAKQRPKRSVLFVWHCGEEKGLWGSRYFTEYPTIPLAQIVAQLNIDMIGRSKKDGDTDTRNKDLTGPNAIYVIGSTMMSTELGKLSQNVNKSFLNLTYDVKYDDPADPNRFFFRSDHYNYARKGIPIIFFFDGVHEDYHRPGDEPQKIDYQKMEKVARTIYM